MAKKIIFSGIQPSGNLHLGNYLGAIKNWVELQEQYQCYFCVVDLHAITVPQDPKELRGKTLEVAKIYLAAGVDPDKCTIFVQSHVSAHSELAWILACQTRVAEMERMTQYKDKARKQPEQTGLGLLAYPALMAADILLYDSDLVPVGEDQTQHLEYSRVIARRFNNHFDNTFKIPEQFTVKEGARIMGLDDPMKKMSKSAESKYNYIALTDSPEEIREKFKKAVTDTGREIKYSQSKLAIMNLMNIYHLLAGNSIMEIEKKYKGKGYAEFKSDLAEIVIDFLAPFQKRMAELSDKEVIDLLRRGAKAAEKIANKKLKAAHKKIGLLV